MLSLDDDERKFRELRRRLAEADAPNACIIESQLNMDLAHIDDSDQLRRVAAHRHALEKYIVLQEPAAQSLLKRIIRCYEERDGDSFSAVQQQMFRKLQVAEQVGRQAIEERNALRSHVEAMRLDILNLERQLRARTEVISMIAHVHKIDVSGMNWKTGEVRSAVDKTMAEIRADNQRLSLLHGDPNAETEEQVRRKAALSEQAASMKDIEHELARGLHSLDGVCRSQIEQRTTAQVYRACQDVSNIGCTLSPGESFLDSTQAT
jgi:hypothetical protein